MLGPKTFWVQKYYGSRKIVDLSLKNILSQTFLVPHLPYGMLLSKVGWIGRGGGVGMGVPFLGFNVAYIPNLSLLQSLEPFEKGSKIEIPPLWNRVFIPWMILYL